MSHQSESNDAANLSGSETILVVDDEVGILNLSDAILSQRGYHVICAENASQALDELDQNSVDLMLTDVVMPEMNGYQLAATVKEKYPDTKIQLVSGFYDSEHADLVSDEMLDNLLHKPYNPKVLLTRVRAQLDA